MYVSRQTPLLGIIGHVKDCYFDDEAWVVRYLVVDTGAWLSSRKVLISPVAIGQPDWSAKVLPVSITKARVKDSPDIDTDKPVSRQQEKSYLTSGNPVHDDPHLRSANAVMKYHIHATDGDIGHVQGLLVDEKSWAIRFVIVNASNWWVGHQVLIAPEWIDDVYWANSKIMVDLTRQAVKDSPHYDADTPLSRAQDGGLYAHYGLSGNRSDKPRSSSQSARIAALKEAAASGENAAIGSVPTAFANSFDNTLIVYGLSFAIGEFSQTYAVRSEVISRVSEAMQRLRIPIGNPETAVRIIRDEFAVATGEVNPSSAPLAQPRVPVTADRRV